MLYPTFIQVILAIQLTSSCVSGSVLHHRRDVIESQSRGTTSVTAFQHRTTPMIIASDLASSVHIIPQTINKIASTNAAANKQSTTSNVPSISHTITSTSIAGSATADPSGMSSWNISTTFADLSLLGTQTAVPDPNGLPFTPIITPGIAVAGVLLLLAGIPYAMIGVRYKKYSPWYYCTFYHLRLICLSLDYRYFSPQRSYVV